MPPVLRPSPSDDPRPTLYGSSTIRRALTRHASAITDWAHLRKYSSDAEFVIQTVVDALEHALGDGDKAVQTLQTLHGWKADMNLRNHVAVAAKHFPECFNYLVTEWVLRTGIRFPGKPGDLVLYWDKENQRKGRVAKVYNKFSTADIEGENGTKVVAAEHVIMNITSGESAVPFRVVHHPAKLSNIIPSSELLPFPADSEKHLKE
jgi:hypothetical protein